VRDPLIRARLVGVIGWNGPAVQRKDDTMSKQTKTTAAKAPTHTAYVVRKVGEKSYWDRIGSVWANADGNGFTLRLHAIPLTGEIVVRKPKSEDAVNDKGGAQ
jgi:hypothetical protein